MSFLVCPQCGIMNFYVKNEKAERLNVKVTRELKIMPQDKTQKLEGYNLDVVYCLGCSWSGPVNLLKKYIL